MSLRRALSFQRRIIPFKLCLVTLTFLVLLRFYFKFQPHMEKAHRTAPERVADEFRIALLKQQDHLFLATTRKNYNNTAGSKACVVDPAITDCQNMGFAAFLLYTLDHILLCRALRINPTVFWRACNSVCSRNPRVNSWEWYFEPVNRGLESRVEKVLCPLEVTSDNAESFILDHSFESRTDVEGFMNNKIITIQERLRVNKLIHQFVQPNYRMKEKVDLFYQQYLAEFTVLGVHVRGTDHWKETSEKTLPSLMSWIKKAQSILETLPRPRKIFIASDNHEVIIKFVNVFGKEMVVFTDAVRAKRYHDQIPPHGFTFEPNAADPYEQEIGTQVLMDILLLAKCDQFLHTESSVASLASYFNPYMTSHFLQDEESDKESGRIHERISVEETEQENLDHEYLDEILECFQKNYLGSAFSNTAKSIIFVNLEQARMFLRTQPQFAVTKLEGQLTENR